MGDKAVESYARDLGVQIPPQPIKIFLYANAEDYAKAEFPRTGGAFKDHLAFTHKNTCDVLMVIQPRPGRPPGEDEGMFEALFAHELCHAVQYRYFPNYDELPDWLSEGLADAWAERAIARGDALCADRSPWFASFILEVRQAIEEGTFIPLEKLLTESTLGHDFAGRQLRYSENFAFVRMLDDPAPANAERRKKFRAFLREALRMPAGPDLVSRVNARFQEMIGAPIAALNAELKKRVNEEKVFPWFIVLREVRALKDGGILAETFVQSPALAFHCASAPLEGPRARIRAEVEVLDLDGKQANLAFGFRSRSDYHVVGFGPGYVSLMHFDGKKWQTLARADRDPAEFGAGKHELIVDIDGPTVYAKLDKKLVLKHALKDGAFPKGRWGIGAWNGRVIFRNPSAQQFPAAPPPKGGDTSHGK